MNSVLAGLVAISIAVSTIEPATALTWRTCNLETEICGRNTAMESAGCSQELENKEAANPQQVDYGHSFTIEPASLITSLVDANIVNYEGNEQANYKALEMKPLAYSVNVLRPVTVDSTLAVDAHVANRYVTIAEFPASVVEGANGELTFTVPALDAATNGGGTQLLSGETTLQLVQNHAPPGITFTLTNNYGSPNYNRLQLCSDIAFTGNYAASSDFQWTTTRWSGCSGGCGQANQGTQQRDVFCTDPASNFDNEVHDEAKCSGAGPKPATSQACTAPGPCGAGQTWSTWASVVAEGDSVIIPAGTTVTLDVTPVQLDNLIVDGILLVAPASSSVPAIVLHADHIGVSSSGEFIAGTAAAPLSRKFNIVLDAHYNSPVPRSKDEHHYGHNRGAFNGLKSLEVAGTLSLHGAETTSWLRLGSTAIAGQTYIELEVPAVNWNVGDEIVIVSSDYYDYTAASEGKPMSEPRTITSVSGSKISFSKALDWSHFGALQTIGGRQVDERAEVILLTRSIAVSGTVPPAEHEGYGAHVVTMSKMLLSNVEFVRGGQVGRLGRYPVHFHHVGDNGKLSYVKNCAIHHTYQRSITIHDTSYVTIETTATYRATGHAIFFENGNEVENVLVGNIVADTRPVEVSDWREDVYDVLPSAYWMTNYNNHLTKNVAADTARGVGFWYKVNNHADNEMLSHPQAMMSALGTFDDNVAHSNELSGIWLWHDWRPCHSFVRTVSVDGDGCGDPTAANPDSCNIFGDGSGNFRFGTKLCAGDTLFYGPSNGHGGGEEAEEAEGEEEDGDRRQRRAPKLHAPLAPGQLNVDSDGNQCGTAYRFRSRNPKFGTCTPGARHTMKRFLGFKHRDIGTAIYLTTTNVGFENFTSVDETTAVRQVQVWTDQASAEQPGLSGFQHQLFENFVVAASSSNRLNSKRFCGEMVARGIVQAGHGCSHCHAWPRRMQGHPGDFAENPVLSANEKAPKDFFANDKSKRQLTGMNIAGEGNAGGQMAKQWTFVDFEKNSACGVDAAVGFKSFIGQEFAAARFTEIGTTFVDSSTNGPAGLPAFGTLLSIASETLFANAELVGSLTKEFPTSSSYLVTLGNMGTPPTLMADLISSMACMNNPNAAELSALCAADKTWWSELALDLQATKDTVDTGEEPGADTCVPMMTALQAPPQRSAQTITGDIPLGSNERGGFHGFRYATNVVVGKQYHVTVPCSEMITSGPMELSWGRTSFLKGVDPERAAEVVLELSGAYNVDASWSDMVLGGTHDVYVASGHFDDVPVFPKSAAAVAGTFGCCSSNGKTFVRVKVGERLALTSDASVDVDTQVSLQAKARPSNSAHVCGTACPGASSAGAPWPYGADFTDTSVADASKQQRLRAEKLKAVEAEEVEDDDDDDNDGTPKPKSCARPMRGMRTLALVAAGTALLTCV